MWQPKQPQSEAVATLIFSVMASILVLFVCRNVTDNADRLPVIKALPAWFLETLVLGQDGAYRAYMRCLGGGGEITVAELAAGRIDHQPAVDAAAVDGKYVFSINIAAGAHAQFTQYATIIIDRGLGMRCIHRSLWKEVGIVW